MSLGDLFRGLFFGRPSQNFPDHRLDEDLDDDHTDGEQDPFFGGRGRDEDGGVEFSIRFTEPDEMMRHFDEMFRNFDELFRGMGIADFPQHRHGVPGIGQPPPQQRRPPSGEDSDSLRDHMLKVPDSRSSGPTETPPSPDRRGRHIILPEHSPHQPTQPPSHFFGGWGFPGLWGRRGHQPPGPEQRTDSDLDEQIKKAGDLSKILPPFSSADRQQMEPSPPPRSLFRGVSVSTFRSADGSVEQRKTVEDPEGSETVVTRSIGDQSHSVTTKTEKDGTIHVSEKFRGMEKKDKPVFDSYYKSPAVAASKKLQQDMMNDTSFCFNHFFTINFPGFGSSR